MIKTTKCLNCGSALNISAAQSIVKCHYCSSEFFNENQPVPPPPLPPNPVPVAPPAQPESVLRIEFSGAWMVVDMDVKIFLDGQMIGGGSIKKGFDVAVKVGAGRHSLELRTSLKKKRYDLDIYAGGNYRAKIEYSRAWGDFSDDLHLMRFA